MLNKIYAFYDKKKYENANKYKNMLYIVLSERRKKKSCQDTFKFMNIFFKCT